MRGRIDADYQPSEEQLSLFPEVSGNDINGLGDPEPRPPRPLYWFEPDTILHGQLQKYFYANAQRLSAGRKEMSSMAERRGPRELEPVEQLALGHRTVVRPIEKAQQAPFELFVGRVLVAQGEGSRRAALRRAESA